MEPGRRGSGGRGEAGEPAFTKGEKRFIPDPGNIKQKEICAKLRITQNATEEQKGSSRKVAKGDWGGHSGQRKQCGHGL